VGQPDALDRDAGLLDCTDDPVHVAAGVHHHRSLAAFVPQDGTVLLEGRDRDDGTA